MITLKNIGYAGRIGNTLFQYTALFGIANKLGLEYGIPYENADEPTKYGYYDFFTNEWIHYRFDLFDAFNLSAKNIKYDDVPTNLYYEKYFQFDPTVFSLPDGTDINGWFQSHRYFNHCELDLRKELQFKDELLISALKHWTSFGFPKGHEDKPKLMISMRIGDGYEFDKNFATANLEYYRNALAQFDLSKYHIVITSDMPDICKTILTPIIGDMKIHVLNEPCPYVTLAFYSLCDAYIIPNSTFAWWGAWFGNSKNKKVIIPKNWFNATVDTSLMSPDNWIKI